MLTTDFVIQDTEAVSFDEIFLSEENKKALNQVLKEHIYFSELSKYGLCPDNKILFHGASGCGKTLTAKAIAKTLNKPAFVLNLSNLVNSRIGETSKNMKAVFDKAQREKAVLFLDEFDQIGKSRTDDERDVGEMRRLVNTIIQLFDYFPKDGVLICATNHIDFIDFALLRRFQLKLSFEMPSKKDLDAYYDEKLAVFPEKFRNIERKYAISYAEAKDYIQTQMKKAIIHDLEKQKNVT
ncbi:AAA family ATPase [Capnocytophaga sp.]|uniref:AAA family ATPase n=1 Tax=Capnocytophaga sp. TaxID=44737 RepID=UPI0026DD188C|nr:ATP-binding protein [Capnocytophaga sp.]MDO5105388.1 ATP-binding protein [Capnocytophaga sp.]